MSEDTPQTPLGSEEHAPVGTLVDLVTGVDEDNPLDLNIAVNHEGKIVVFHDKPFKDPLSWLEFDLHTRNLDFILEDGELRNTGIPIQENISKNMQNTHQILMILMDDSTGEAKEGHYIPLIVHHSE